MQVRSNRGRPDVEVMGDLRGCLTARNQHEDLVFAFAQMGRCRPVSDPNIREKLPLNIRAEDRFAKRGGDDCDSSSRGVDSPWGTGHSRTHGLHDKPPLESPPPNEVLRNADAASSSSLTDGGREELLHSLAHAQVEISHPGAQRMRCQWPGLRRQPRCSTSSGCCRGRSDGHGSIPSRPCACAPRM